MKKSLVTGAKWLLGIAAPVIVTASITGQPLSGLMKLKGLGDTFLKSSVPAWVFTAVFVVALIAAEYAIEHLLKATKKLLHFIPDPDECGWGQAADREQGGKKISVMFVRVEGTLTYDGERETQFLSAYLKSTQSSGMRTRVPAIDGSNREVETSPLQLTPHVPQHVSMDLFVWPMVGTAKKSLRSHLILRDQYNRDHDVGVVEFQSRA
ncbi:MAG: hypothetical protein JWQ87_5525 [Candidatus Sulfotelmatobacter sp.]|nr:hypothetical protein [Candidatus Sulfotelmatobacter sp.]